MILLGKVDCVLGFLFDVVVGEGYLFDLIYII